MIMVVPFEDWHLDWLIPRLREHDWTMALRHGGEFHIRSLIEQMKPHAVIMSSITTDGEVAAIWIMQKKWNGVMTIHAYTGQAVDRNKVEFFKACIRGLETAESSMKLHRIEAVVWAGYDRSVKWLERLGFAQEGTMKKFGPDGLDAVLMARVSA